MTRPDGTVLLTGATGFVGMELLARYLERTERPVLTIVRAGERRGRARADRRGAREPVRRSRAERYADRVTAVAGDLTAPRLGLDAAALGLARAAESTMIVHCAASVSFGHVARGGARDQRRGHPPDARVRRPGAASSACSSATPRSRPRTSPAPTPAASPSATSTSARASTTPTSSRSSRPSSSCARGRDLPFTILRPSIVVGDRNSGWTSAFNVLYWPLRALARGLFPAVPATRIGAGRRGLDRLRRRRHPRAVRVRRRDRPDLSPDRRRGGEHDRRDRRARERLLPPAAAAAALAGRVRCRSTTESLDARCSRKGALYFPYFSVTTTFDDAFTRARLEPAGISVAPLRDYMDRLLDFATRAAGASARSRGSTRRRRSPALSA